MQLGILEAWILQKTLNVCKSKNGGENEQNVVCFHKGWKAKS